MDVSSSHGSTFDVDCTVDSGCTKRPLAISEGRSFRRVNFVESVSVYLIEPASEFSEDEKAAAFFSRQDFEDMRNGRRDTVKVMEQFNELVDDAHHYYRGLEFKTREGSRRRQWNIVDAAMAVFDEQMMQLNGHYCSTSTHERVGPESIAKAYMACTASSRTAAAERGLHDQRVALESITAVPTAGSQLLGCIFPRRQSFRAA
jgi:hypothetical protein